MPRILDYKLYAKLHLQCTGLCLKPHWIYYKPNFILSHGEGGLMPKLPRCGIQSDHIWKKCAVLFFIILSQFHTSIFNSKLGKKKKKSLIQCRIFFLFIYWWVAAFFMNKMSFFFLVQTEGIQKMPNLDYTVAVEERFCQNWQCVPQSWFGAWCYCVPKVGLSSPLEVQALGLNRVVL